MIGRKPDIFPRVRDGVIVILASFLLLGGCGTSKGWTIEPGQHPMSFEREITKRIGLQYLVFLPASYEREKRQWPLLLFLHGSGERGKDTEKVKTHGPPAIVEKRPDFPFIVVSPQCPDGEPWSAETLNALLDEVILRLPVDVERVYVTGLSMGGAGTWDFASRYPHRVAAIAPICGWTDEARAPYLRDVPVWAFHGAQDDIVPLRESQVMISAVTNAGGNARLTIYPQAGHDSWTETYANPELYDWFLLHKRVVRQE